MPLDLITRFVFRMLASAVAHDPELKSSVAGLSLSVARPSIHPDCFPNAEDLKIKYDGIAWLVFPTPFSFSEDMLSAAVDITLTLS
jgi:hypothetical protein